MPLLDAFKLDEFQLQPVLDTWDIQYPPRFHGKPEIDPPVDAWLDAIKAGCIERNIPEGYWHKAGQYYLGPRARARFDELKKVLRHMHGGRYRFDWKRFKVAMRNMGWDIEDSKTESFKVQSKPSGVWWIASRGKDKQDASTPPPSVLEKRSSRSGKPSKHEKSQSADSVFVEVDDNASLFSTGSAAPRPSVTQRMTSWVSRKPTAPTPDAGSSSETASLYAESTRSQTTSLAYSTTSTAPSTAPPSTPPAACAVVPLSSKEVERSSSSFWPFGASTPATPPASVLSASDKALPETPGEVSTATANVPVWLLNATGALDFFNNEHPKTMTTVAAVLITVGSLPAMPGFAAVAGGTFLASHAFQAAGAIALGVGNWLRQTQDASAKAAAANTPALEGAAPPSGELAIRK